MKRRAVASKREPGQSASGSKRAYHHGNLAESLLDAVDDIATQFGLEAVTLRACAKHVGVSPSSAFRHYVDKRALLTAFATRALSQLSDTLERAARDAESCKGDPYVAVSLAYITYALEKPAFFRAMWRKETLYSADETYLAAANRLIVHLQGGFAASIADHDPDDLSASELLAWSAVHGLANLFVDGPVGQGQSREDQLSLATEMIEALRPAVN
jgi:AcrR family transcriptional regulator